MPRRRCNLRNHDIRRTAGADQPNAVVSLLDADGLAGEDLTEIDLLVIEADSAQVVTVAALS